jgi:hypothetical protein
LRDGWILAGLAILVAMVLLTEGTLWPAERRLQVSLVSLQSGGTPAARDAAGRDARVVMLSAELALILLALGAALMVVQP